MSKQTNLSEKGIAGGGATSCAQRSMTGYATATARGDGFALTASVRSVNHRHLDLRTRLPESLLPLERDARSMIQSKNPRGHVDLTMSLELAVADDLRVDEAMAGKYVETSRRLGTQYGLESAIDAGTLLQMPGVSLRNGSAAAPSPSISTEMESVFRALLADVVEQWDRMRAEEAALLAQDMSERIALVQKATEKVEQDIRPALAHAKSKLSERLQALVGQPGLDPARLA